MNKHSAAATAAAFLIIAAAATAFAGGTRDAAAAAGGKPTVVVSILPQKYFVSRIAGNRAAVEVLVGPGQNPHSYEPTPRQMATLAGADAWILSKTDFELALVPKITALYPKLALVDGTEGVAFRLMEEHGHEDEDENHEEEAEGGNLDRHTWLGREPALILAARVRDVLIGIDYAGRSVYEAGYAALAADINREFDALTADLAPLRGKTVFVYHPAFGYFLDEFGIRQEAVETGGKEPSPKALAALIEKARAEGAPAVFVQAQFPTGAAKTVADAVGAQVVLLDDLAPDWLENIRRMGTALAAAARSAR